MIDTSDNGRSAGGQKSAEGGRGDPNKASPAAVEKYVHGVAYPADKSTLLERAKENNAPSDVMHVLERFDEKDYKSPIDIAKEVGRVE
jgi:hypothetical protein